MTPPTTAYKYNEWVTTVVAAIAAFCVYTCMYAFRKPFTVGDFSNIKFAGLDYKIWLVIAQTVGYTISKFAGIRFIGELKSNARATGIIKLIVLSWLALLFFAITPAPYNIIFLFLNAVPLGVIYGLVFSYLEGRKNTELLGAVLACSFIFASGFTQSAGKMVLNNWQVSQWWMPWVTGLIFFIPLIFFTWLLDKTPPPSAADIRLRTKRRPMTKKARKDFIKAFFPGIAMLIIAYMLLTIMRDIRSNFASDIWKELGHGNNNAVFTKSEIPASLFVLIVMSLLIIVKRNIHALLINHLLIIAGLIIAFCCTVLFLDKELSGFWWMTLTGLGLYMAYVPFNCMLFERMIASFKYISNAGFIIYVADSFGYLGSNAVLITKNFIRMDTSWTGFFANIILVASIAGLVLVSLSALYFHKKYRVFSFSPGLKEQYA